MNEIAHVSRLNSRLFLGGLMRTLRFRSPHLYLPETVHVKTELTPPTAEQHYEGLTGFNKAETGAKHGKAQNEEIIFQIKEGKHVLIAAHVNSLRGTVKHLESLSEEAIMELNLSPGIPIMYVLDKNLKPIKPMQFLGDEETEYAMEAVAAQGKAKK